MSWLIANSCLALVLALLVAGIGRLLRPAPAVMHVLWLFVLLKLVTPPLFEVPVWVLPAAAPQAVSVDLLAPRAAAAPPAAVPAPSAGEVLFWLWAAGSIGFVLLLGAGIVRGRARLSRLGPVPPWLRAEVAALAERLGVRVPLLLDDPHATSPCVWSLGRARLVLPVHVLARTPAKGRAAELAHELAHLRRGDHFVACLELLFAAVLWWHPLFWLARARMRLWAELACDAWAVAAVPGGQLDYATALIDAVDTPDSAVRGLTVLAARPAARAAFEKRLHMILNESVSCRVSRGWWLPIATFGLALFTAPVAAQGEEQEPVRVEIKVNGKSIGELSAEERSALLKMLREEEAKAPDADAKLKPAAPRKKAPGKAKVDVGPIEFPDFADEIKKAFAEARVEVLHDADLRELGITEEVAKLIDDIAQGKGMQGSLNDVIKGAMKGSSKVIVKELKSDPDLRAMGLSEAIEGLVTGIVENEANQERFGEFVRRAVDQALRDAKVEIRADPELKKLGITTDVEKLLDGVFAGDGDFNANLQQVIEKALKAAQRREPGEGGADEALAPKKKAVPQKPKAKQAEPVIR